MNINLRKGERMYASTFRLHRPPTEKEQGAQIIPRKRAQRAAQIKPPPKNSQRKCLSTLGILSQQCASSAECISVLCCVVD